MLAPPRGAVCNVGLASFKVTSRVSRRAGVVSTSPTLVEAVEVGARCTSNAAGDRVGGPGGFAGGGTEGAAGATADTTPVGDEPAISIVSLPTLPLPFSVDCCRAVANLPEFDTSSIRFVPDVALSGDPKLTLLPPTFPTIGDEGADITPPYDPLLSPATFLSGDAEPLRAFTIGDRSTSTSGSNGMTESFSTNECDSP